MPTKVGYDLFGEENLVFGYDLGDVSNSYKGKPTTNFIANLGDPTEERARGEFGQYFNLVPIFETYGLVPYTLSMEIKGNIPGACLVYMQNGSYTKYAFVGTWVDITTEWQRFVFPNITPSGPTAAWQTNTPGDNRAMLATYTIYGTGRNPTVRNVQLELGSYATPFTPSARSATQGLLDLTGNSTINLTNVSFDSNAQMTFDGTNDYVDLSSATSLLNLGSTFSIEGILKLDNTSQEFGIVFSSLDVATGSQTKGVGFYWKKTAEYGMSANTLRLQLGLALWGWHIFASNGISISDTNYHHVVVTLTGGNTSSPTIVFYIDGVAQAATKWTAGSTGAINNSSNANSLRLGSIYTASDPSYNNLYSAELLNVVKIYNRALTASEIKSNFNAIKGRFNI